MFKILFVSALLFFLGYGIFSFFLRNFGGNRNNQKNSHSRTNGTENPQEEKQFSKDIGEYVPYEEIKDDKTKE